WWVARVRDGWGKWRLVAMLTGDLEGLPDSLTRLSTTGILSGESAKIVAEWVDAAGGGGLLAATNATYASGCTPRAAVGASRPRTTRTGRCRCPRRDAT